MKSIFSLEEVKMRYLGHAQLPAAFGFLLRLVKLKFFLKEGGYGAGIRVPCNSQGNDPVPRPAFPPQKHSAVLLRNSGVLLDFPFLIDHRAACLFQLGNIGGGGLFPGSKARVGVGGFLRLRIRFLRKLAVF